MEIKKALLAAAITVSGFIWSKLHFVSASVINNILLAAAFFLIIIFAAKAVSGKDCGMKGPVGEYPPVKTGTAVFIYSFAALCLLWSEYFPYGSSPDTVNQWNQIHGIISYNDVHAIGHTIFLKLLLGIWDNYIIVIIAHLLMISGLYGAYGAYFARRGFSAGTQLVMISIFTSCYAPIQAYVFPWKDTPYIFFAGILMLLLIIRIDNPENFGAAKSALAGGAAAMMCLMRLNGAAVAVVIVPYLCVCFIKKRQFAELTAAVLTMTVICCGTNIYAYNVLGVKSLPNGFAVQTFGSGIAAVVNDKSVTEEELDEINEILPVDWMRDNYTPGQGSSLIWNGGDPDILKDPQMQIFNNEFVVAMGYGKWKVIKLYFKLLPKHFGVCLKDIIYNTTVIWGIPDYRSEIVCFNNSVLFAVLLAEACLLRRRKTIKKYIPVFAVPVLNALSIAVSAITNETRYLLMSVTMFPVLFMLILANNDEAAAGRV